MQDATEQHTTSEADVLRVQTELRELEREMSQTKTDDVKSAMDAGVIGSITQTMNEALQKFSSEIGAQNDAPGTKFSKRSHRIDACSLHESKRVGARNEETQRISETIRFTWSPR